jgi:GAF domain-containing protein
MLESEISAADAFCLLELAEMTFRTSDISELAGVFLNNLARMISTPAAVLYLEDPHLPPHAFFQVGLLPEAVPNIKDQCAARFHPEPGKANLQPIPLTSSPKSGSQLSLFPLHGHEKAIGLLGVSMPASSRDSTRVLLRRAVGILTYLLRQMIDRLNYEKQISNLTTYMNVSSMIAQAVDLREVLEAVLYFCMEAVYAEAASVLLLDYDKKNFVFYSSQGSNPLENRESFPSDQGLAGHALQTQQSEIINDVQNDPRFYHKVDEDTGFCTRNMIVIPLTASEEKIGVLEIINKVGGEPFYEEERLLLYNFAEEIAFAIRNAKLFEALVNSYCKQRQGLNTCKGCKRPLGSWTPCVKYREASIEV